MWTEVEVLYEDEHILCVNKPAGLATESAKVGEKDLLTEARKYLKQKGEKPEIYPVHRLDQPVSGIVIMAKTSLAAAGLSKGMQEAEYNKDYRAMVYITKECAPAKVLEDYLLKDTKLNLSKVVGAQVKGAKKAILSYETMESDGVTACLNVHLQTGRHHQIRVQLANAGLPILGDLKYGTQESIALSKEKAISFIALTAYHTKFTHPVTGRVVELTV